ncbi:MAG: type II toxin-antitoxin system HicB family antitoxin [Defluviitaleaceae bacterium]|nr:type II toxin-antitoxin system HicB family antitoxin [Defluviitaleaceae bacterium]MCL2274932.1 type II toxin-antitoxin system HicB family antitoxin [Defluviitaleaceae bacterium]
MITAYPIILHPANEGGFIVYVPDFDINTQGETIAEALYMARDAIGLTGITMQDMNQLIPSPTITEPPHNENEMVSWVDIDFNEYRRKHDNRSVRRNITLPAWLDDAAKEANINVSGFIQSALKTHLNIASR